MAGERLTLLTLAPSGQRNGGRLSSLLLCSLVSGLADEQPGKGVCRQRVRDFQHAAGAAEVGDGQAEGEEEENSWSCRRPIIPLWPPTAAPGPL